jgi:cell division transport system ATP-binding protein
MITVNHLFKSYRPDRWVLRDLSFKVDKGDFVVIAGPGGAGKSTILRILSMQERPTRGEAVVAGYSSLRIRPNDVPFYRRKIGLILQEPLLLEDRTVYENVLFALEVIGTPPRVIGPRVLQALTQVGMGRYRDAFPCELAASEQQKVAIARALVKEPLLLLADEPTAGLDFDSTLGMIEIFSEINTRGTTILLATNDERVVRASARRTITINEGQIVNDKIGASVTETVPQIKRA